ncbi:ester cyclase [Erythrobacter mangrovi]|uniref:Ester cyclase n=1 Tax=Erythrobacter mangrovi TaxID=2739433 RepID=A0A7D4B8E3_9SPHN|nr:ester cyclase [Erythrobacter mangrovi]QKG70281.1 ester cyclase [Erythrobacter mangrovi]
MMHDMSRKRRLADFIRLIWDQGDLEAADAFLSPAYTIHHDPGDPWDGRTLDLPAYKERVRISRSAFPDQMFDIQAMYADGDGVAMTWLWAATHLGDLPGYPATGKPVRMSGATVYGFDAADRITGHWQIADRLSIYQQLQVNSLQNQ